MSNSHGLVNSIVVAWVVIAVRVAVAVFGGGAKNRRAGGFLLRGLFAQSKAFSSLAFLRFILELPLRVEFLFRLALCLCNNKLIALFLEGGPIAARSVGAL